MYKTGKIALILFGIMIFMTSMASISLGQSGDTTEPIKTLNYQAAEIRSVIRHLADYGKINVVVAPAVSGNVTISLNDVTWQEALEIIGRTYELAIVFEEEDNYIRVLPAETYRKEVTSEKQYVVDQRKLTELETRIIRINNSTSESIKDAVQSLLTDRGKATADPRTNSIILQEIPENIERVLEYVTTLDSPPRQIRISAQMLEISSSELTELGIDWTLNSAGGNILADGTAETQQQTSQILDRVANPSGQFWVKSIQEDWDIEATVSALISTGHGKIIAHPEITTIDNEEANIQMGQKVPIKQFDQNGNTVISFEEVGTMLKVTPHITSNNKILMHMIPERSTYEFDPNGVIINTSNAETNVVVQNGQTAVIGGLTTQDEVETEVGIPVLKDIPFLGALFRYNKKEIKNRDLVIFVTPTIVEDFAVIDNSLDTP
jgi:type IV pilus assembly protein PilQ